MKRNMKTRIKLMTVNEISFIMRVRIPETTREMQIKVMTAKEVLFKTREMIKETRKTKNMNMNIPIQIIMKTRKIKETKIQKTITIRVMTAKEILFVTRLETRKT
uniref:Uncharacterized protein n=1 Tax=Cacopsylla melanoneura TaxID=428564 RepID=A0A8D8LC26_9HEMI